jgi:hypothetical protein
VTLRAVRSEKDSGRSPNNPQAPLRVLACTEDRPYPFPPRFLPLLLTERPEDGRMSARWGIVLLVVVQPVAAPFQPLFQRLPHPPSRGIRMSTHPLQSLILSSLALTLVSPVGATTTPPAAEPSASIRAEAPKPEAPKPDAKAGEKKPADAAARREAGGEEAGEEGRAG